MLTPLLTSLNLSAGDSPLVSLSALSHTDIRLGSHLTCNVSPASTTKAPRVMSCLRTTSFTPAKFLRFPFLMQKLLWIRITRANLLASQCLQPLCHPNTAAVPSHLPRPRVLMSLKRITPTVKWTSPARSLPAPQVPLLPASHTALMLHMTTVKQMLTSGVGRGMWRETPWHSLRALHHPPQPRGLSLHRNLSCLCRS